MEALRLMRYLMLYNISRQISIDTANSLVDSPAGGDENLGY